MAENKHTIQIILTTNDSGEVTEGFGDPLFSEDKVESPMSSYDAASIKMAQKLAHPIKTLESIVFEKSSGRTFATIVGVAAGLVSNAALMEFNRYTTLKENYMAENMMNNLKQSVGTLSRIGASAGAFAVQGAIFGPGGAALGALAGVTLGVVNAEKNKAMQIDQYERQLNQINLHTSFNESRASLVNGNRGTEN